MNKTMKRITSIILAMAISFSLVSCFEKPKVTLEMAYATSAESMIETTLSAMLVESDDIEFTYENNIALITLPEEMVQPTLDQINEQVETMKTTYVNTGFVNDITVNDTYTKIEIDFNSSITEVLMYQIIQEASAISLSGQCFSNVPAKDFAVELSFSVDGQFVGAETMDFELLTQS